MHSETCPKYGELLRFNPNVKLGDRATNYANCHAYCDKCRIGISNSRNPEKRTYIYKQGCSVLKKWWHNVSVLDRINRISRILGWFYPVHPVNPVYLSVLRRELNSPASTRRWLVNLVRQGEETAIEHDFGQFLCQDVFV